MVKAPVKQTKSALGLQYQCCTCGRFLSDAKFYKSTSSLYDGIGHLPACKECVEREFKRYKIEYNDLYRAMQRICMAYDIYYDRKIVDACRNAVDNMMGNYLRKTNLGQYKNRTFDTSIEEGFLFLDGIDNKGTSSSSSKGTNQRSIDKWGAGLSAVDYEELDKHYRFLKDANPNCDSNQEIFINELCYTKMQQLRAVRNGDAETYNKMTDSYRKTFQQAGLKTVKDAVSTEEFTVSVNAETIEKYTPAEFYKNQELYKDFDGIGDYMNRNVLRPLRNLMFGTKDKDPEYYVKDDGEAGGYDDE